MIRQTIETVDTLDVLTPQQRKLIDAEVSGWLLAELHAARPDLPSQAFPDAELGAVELAAYWVVTDLDGNRETRLIIAPRDPRLQPGVDVAAERDSAVLWSDSSDERVPADGTEIHVSSRLVPFDWASYWAAAAD